MNWFCDCIEEWVSGIDSSYKPSSFIYEDLPYFREELYEKDGKFYTCNMSFGGSAFYVLFDKDISKIVLRK